MEQFEDYYYEEELGNYKRANFLDIKTDAQAAAAAAHSALSHTNQHWNELFPRDTLFPANAATALESTRHSVCSTNHQKETYSTFIQFFDQGDNDEQCGSGFGMARKQSLEMIMSDEEAFQMQPLPHQINHQSPPETNLFEINRSSNQVSNSNPYLRNHCFPTNSTEISMTQYNNGVLTSIILPANFNSEQQPADNGFDLMPSYFQNQPLETVIHNKADMDSMGELERSNQQLGFDYFAYFQQQQEGVQSMSSTSLGNQISLRQCESSRTVSLNDLGRASCGESMHQLNDLRAVASRGNLQFLVHPRIVVPKIESIESRKSVSTITLLTNDTQEDFNKRDFTKYNESQKQQQQEIRLLQMEKVEVDILRHRNSSCDIEEPSENLLQQNNAWEGLFSGFKVEAGINGNSTEASQKTRQSAAATIKEVEDLKLCNKKNVVKNIMNAFKNFILDNEQKNSQKVNERIVELYNTGKEEVLDGSGEDSLSEITKKFRRYINSKNFNHYSIRLLILHPNYGPLLKYFLAGPAFHWIATSKVNDHAAHFVMINFLALSCADVQIIDQLKRHEKKKAHFQ